MGPQILCFESTVRMVFCLCQNQLGKVVSAMESGAIGRSKLDHLKNGNYRLWRHASLRLPLSFEKE